MVSFIFLYVIYKTLLIKYFSKTTAFNQELPEFAIFYFKIGIVIHIIMAAFIFSNENLLSTSGFIDDQMEKIGADGDIKSKLVDDLKKRLDDHPLLERF